MAPRFSRSSARVVNKLWVLNEPRMVELESGVSSDLKNSKPLLLHLHIDHSRCLHRVECSQFLLLLQWLLLLLEAKVFQSQPSTSTTYYFYCHYQETDADCQYFASGNDVEESTWKWLFLHFFCISSTCRKIGIVIVWCLNCSSSRNSSERERAHSHHCQDGYQYSTQKIAGNNLNLESRSTLSCHYWGHKSQKRLLNKMPSSSWQQQQSGPLPLDLDTCLPYSIPHTYTVQKARLCACIIFGVITKG